LAILLRTLFSDLVTTKLRSTGAENKIYRKKKQYHLLCLCNKLILSIKSFAEKSNNKFSTEYEDSVILAYQKKDAPGLTFSPGLVL
jgi:hypothetical protein